jgi:hypothetical protein
MMNYRFASEPEMSQQLIQRSGSSPVGSCSGLQTIELVLYAIGGFSLFVALVDIIVGLEGRPYGYLGNFIALVILSLLIPIAGILFLRKGITKNYEN